MAVQSSRACAGSWFNVVRGSEAAANRRSIQNVQPLRSVQAVQVASEIKLEETQSRFENSQNVEMNPVRPSPT
jgi:hypothetical protein